MPVSSYPLMLKGLNNISYQGRRGEEVGQAELAVYHAKQVASFTRQIEIIEAAMAVGSIANPVWVDVKFTMGNLLERAWNGLEVKSWSYRDLPDDVAKIVSDLNIYRPEMHTIPGKIVKLQKVKDKHPMLATWLAIFEELAPLGEAFKVLSKNTVKRQPKPVEDRVAKYNAPSVNGTATAKVRDLLIQITEDTKQALQTSIAEYIQSLYDEYMNAAQEATEILEIWEYFCPRKAHFPRQQEAQIVSKLVDGGINRVRATTKPNYKTIIANMAEENASRIREDFVYKNLAKIASIVEAKGNYKTGEILGHYISLEGLKGTLRFRFEDGSHFTVQNSVVYVQNSYGTKFNRWPLTFHDVVLPGGKKKMGRPSEQRMNEVFTKGGE